MPAHNMELKCAQLSNNFSTMKKMYVFPLYIIFFIFVLKEGKERK
jgi:hypothetical protein